jgi:hypothetical protein
VNTPRNVPSVEGARTPVEQSTYPAVPQQIHVVDRVRPADHPGDQREDLRGGVGPGLRRDRQPLDQQGRQPTAVRQRHHRTSPAHDTRFGSSNRTPTAARA